MITAPWVYAVAVLALLALAAPPAGARQPAPPDESNEKQTVPADGTEVFRALLALRKIAPASDADVNALVDRLTNAHVRAPADGLIVVVLNPRTGQEDGLVSKALFNGAAVLVASDVPWFFRPTGAAQQVRVHGDEVTNPHAELVYQNNPFCPFAVPVPGDGVHADPGPAGAVFRDLHRVVTNRPTYLIANRYEQEARFRLATFPAESEGRFPPLGLINRGPEGGPPPQTRFRLNPVSYPFAVGGHGPHDWNRTHYRFILMADASVLINQMLYEREADNFQLANRLIDFLEEGPNGAKRRRCLFYENGTRVGRFDKAIRLTRPPLPLPNLRGLEQKAIEMGERLAAKLEDEDVPNQLVVGGNNPDRQARRVAWVLQGLLVGGCAWAVWFLLRRVWRTRQPTDLPRPFTPTGTPPAPAAGGLFDRRERELLRRNNVYEPVRDLVRGLFAACGAPPEPGPKPPPVVFSPDARKPGRIADAVDRLWKVAYGRPAPLTVQKWQELEPLVERLRAAFGRGSWRFAPAGNGSVG